MCAAEESVSYTDGRTRVGFRRQLHGGADFDHAHDNGISVGPTDVIYAYGGAVLRQDLPPPLPKTHSPFPLPRAPAPPAPPPPP